MNPNNLREMARDICNTYNYPCPKKIILSSKLKSTVGRCFKDEGIIELNEWFVRNNRKEIVESILKHEICHLRHCNHSKGFMQAVKIMGSAMYIEDLFDDIVYPAKYVYKCPGCNSVRWTNRKYKGERSCAECGGRDYNPVFKLILVQDGGNK